MLTFSSGKSKTGTETEKLSSFIVLEEYIYRAATVECGDVAYLIKAHIFRLVCIDMEVYACSCSLQTM